MIHTQNQKVVLLTPPAAIIDNAAVTIAELDTVQNGNTYDYVDIYYIFGAMDIAATVLKLTETDTTGTGYADVAGTSYGAGNNPALPSATDDNKIFSHHVALNGRKRFIKPALTVGDGAAGTFVTVIAVLSRPKESPNTATKRGLAAEIFVPSL